MKCWAGAGARASGGSTVMFLGTVMAQEENGFWVISPGDSNTHCLGLVDTHDGSDLK